MKIKKDRKKYYLKYDSAIGILIFQCGKRSIPINCNEFNLSLYAINEKFITEKCKVLKTQLQNSDRVTTIYDFPKLPLNIDGKIYFVSLAHIIQSRV